MNKSLDHLPLTHQKNLEYIVNVIRDEFEQVTGFANGKKKHSRLLKIILFGSHATGKWVNDPAHGYLSDYDILVILNNEDLLEEYKIWTIAEQRINQHLKQPLNLLVHTLEQVNEALAQGHYFFTDIRKEGILLLDADGRELVQAGNLTPEEARKIAEEHYAHWFESARSFIIDFGHCMDRQDYKKAAFELHQAAERFYACFLLVTTNYKPNTHNLARLNHLAILQNKQMIQAFPMENKMQRRHFQLLKNAYIDARYSTHYEITREELDWLVERVVCLQKLTERFCQETMANFK
ncbi:MAG TPA: HEPN domain-containing protein [Gammaproteobacteria bacterium]|nr:HEPN domain-containing protein [Gammaproteobacteria bacterium]